MVPLCPQYMKRATLLVVALGLAAGLLLATGGSFAAEANNDAVGNDDTTLSIGVQQGAGAVTVAVTADGVGVSNATVEMVGDVNASAQQTDAAGYVSFDRPNETVDVTITAETANASAQVETTIQGAEGQGPAHTPPGQQQAALVHSIQQANLTGPMGQYIAGPIVPDHPGAPANAGPPAHAGPPDHAGGEDNETGPPAHAGPHSDDGNETADDHPGNAHGQDDDDEPERGPPDHAGPDDDEDDERERGPPDHAGPDS